MCDEADYSYDVLREQQRRARKEHVCCACSETIRRGDVYQYSYAYSRAYNDHPEQYKHCLRCAKMLREILDARRGEDVAVAWQLDCGEDWKDTIGELPEHVAALAFLTRDEIQAQFKPTRRPR